MLTKTEKEYLTEKREFSSGNKRVIRHRINKKLNETYEDLKLLIKNKEKWTDTNINESEKKAKDFLEKLGWEPIKNDSSPDFICSKNRYVEVKTVSDSGFVSIGLEQLKKMDHLEKNNNVFLLILDKDDKIHMFNMKLKQIT